MANRVSIDDEDSRIQYSVGQWKLTDGKPDEFKHTSHRTRKAGATAILIFDGSAVDIYGTLPNAQPADTVASFTIDGVNFATTTLPRSPVVAYRQLLFTASNLDDGQHTLIVTCVADGGPLQLDYFDVISSILTTSPSTTSLHQPTPITTLQSSTRLTLIASTVHTVRPWSSPDAVSSSVGPSNPSTLIPSTSSSATDSPETNPGTSNPSAPSTFIPSPSSPSTFIPSPSPSTFIPSPSPSAAVSPKPNPGTNNPSTASRAEKPVGMIIGGAVGGVAALAVAVFFCGYYYRRRRARCHAVQYSPPSPFRALGRPQSEAITKARRIGMFASRSDLDLQGPQPPSASNDSRYVTPSGIPIEKSTRRTRGKKYRGTDSINTGTSDIPREDEPPPYGHLETSASDSGSVLCLV